MTFPFLFPFANSLVAYNTDGTWGFPVQQEPLGGAPLSPRVRPVFSPPLGVVPALIIYKTITVIPKLWHCSSAGDLHTCNFWLLSVPLHNCSNQKVKHCLTLLHHFRSTWTRCIAPLLPGYIHWEKDVAGEGPAFETEKLST